MAIITVGDVKERIGIGNEDVGDDITLTTAVNAAIQQVQDHCDRQFTADGSASARVFVATNPNICYVDDISTTTGLVVETDPGADGTFDVTWAATDYQLEPLNAIHAGQTWPYTALRAIKSYTFPRSGGEALVRVTADWGWAAVPDAVVQATIVQAISLWKAVDAPFGATANADAGIMRIRTGLHPTAEALLREYRRQPVLVL